MEEQCVKKSIYTHGCVFTLTEVFTIHGILQDALSLVGLNEMPVLRISLPFIY